MPGLIGFIKRYSEDESTFFIKKMALALEKDNRFHREFLVDQKFAAGQVTLPVGSNAQKPFSNGQKSISTFFYGELFNTDELISKLSKQGIEIQRNNLPELIYYLFEIFGLDFISELNGAFLIAIWDHRQKKLTLINDRLGLHPLYFSARNGHFIFASGIRAILADQEMEKEIDRTAIAEFLTFDHILGQRTLLRDVKLLPQASILQFQDGHMMLESYHTLKFNTHHELRPVADYLEEFQFLIRQAVQRQYQGDEPISLMLSGGMDSRYILALMREVNPNKNLHTFTWSIPKSDDSKFASESARKAKTEHHFFNLSPDWLLEKGSHAVEITEGNANIVNLHALAALDQETEISQIIFKGFMGDAMMGFGIRPRFWADYDDQTRMEVHLEAYRDYRVLTFDTPNHPDIFSDSFLRETSESWREDFSLGMNSSNSNQMNDQRIYFDLTQRVPRMTINGVEVTRDRAIVRLPFADNDLLDFSLTVPPWLRLGRTLMVQAFIENYPEYAKIPIAQTRLPMISCAREVLQKNWQFIQWHLRNNGLSRLAGPQSRPYKDYNKWFRTNLRQWVEANLLSKDHLQRGYFRPETVKRIVSEHMNGANHAVKIGALLSIELFHQLYID